MAVAVGKQPGVIRNLVMMVGVDKTDEQGRTPLMFAALGNKVHKTQVVYRDMRSPLSSIQRASCTTLIDCGANVDTQDASGLTALHVACYHGAKEATRVLLSRKASVTAVDKMVGTINSCTSWKLTLFLSNCRATLHSIGPLSLTTQHVCSCYYS